MAACDNAVRVRSLLLTGSGTAFTTATVLLVLLATTGGNLAITWSCLFFMVSAFGFLFPALITSGQEIGRDAPGATSKNPAPHAAAAAVVP